MTSTAAICKCELNERPSKKKASISISSRLFNIFGIKRHIHINSYIHTRTHRRHCYVFDAINRKLVGLLSIWRWPKIANNIHINVCHFMNDKKSMTQVAHQVDRSSSFICVFLIYSMSFNCQYSLPNSFFLKNMN